MSASALAIREPAQKRAALARVSCALPIPKQQPCTAELVMGWLRRVAGYSVHDHEIAQAIADASRHCPIWDDEAGALRTAAVLVALAITTSNCHPSLVSYDGKAFGLFQIRIPNPNISADVLLLPRTAAYVAIDLLRQGLELTPDGPLAHALLWYPDAPGLPSSPREAWVCEERLQIAHQLLGGS